MEIFFFTIAPAILTWAILSAMPAGRWFLIGLGAFALLWFDSADFGPANGSPDAFSHLAQRIGTWGTLLAALMVTAAQLWRWHRKKADQPTYYGPLVAGSGAITLLFCFSAIGT